VWRAIRLAHWRWRGPHLRGPYHVGGRGEFPGGRTGVGPGGGGAGRFVAPGGGALTDRVLAIAPGQAEISLEAPSHVADVVLEAFNPDGTLAQRSIVLYSQGYNFGIVAQGRADVLPAVFTGAPASPDLETRARVATVAVRGPIVGPRSGAFDTLRRNDERIDAIVGPKRWSGECVWFDRGADSQIEAFYLKPVHTALCAQRM
jgi:hypothetical protein